MIGPERVAPPLLDWFDRHGRHHLPWQKDPTPYRVWVSEVMLQQTQVAAVIPFYVRFLERLPNVRALAAAPLDEILHLWTGLGYYSRARNLKACASLVVSRHGGEFPDSIEALVALPGIGRSTAGAILALAGGRRHAILDGNAKRVLARVFGIDGDPGTARVQAALWERAEACTPARRVAAYTQAIMDLGATVCARRRPACTVCPLGANCVAAREGRQAQLPGARRRRVRTSREGYLLIAEADEGRAILVEQRPAPGVWGGLWSPPQFESEVAALAWCRRELGEPEPVPRAPALAPIDHAFTHFDLRLVPLRVRVRERAPKHCDGVRDRNCGGASGAEGDRKGREGGRGEKDENGEAREFGAGGAGGEDYENGDGGVAGRRWYSLRAPPRIGLPQPIRQLFARLMTEYGGDGAGSGGN